MSSWMMKGIVQIDTMKVRELKELLSQFDDDLYVMDSWYNDIDEVIESHEERLIS